MSSSRTAFADFTLKWFSIDCSGAPNVVSVLTEQQKHFQLKDRVDEVDYTLPIVAFIVLANSLFGLIAGYLYWQKGLEAAIIAHMSTHVVIVTAIQLAT